MAMVGFRLSADIPVEGSADFAAAAMERQATNPMTATLMDWLM
jgi:hypothetical protein